MQSTIQSDLIRGHINTIILKALFEGDRYGYDIIKEIEQKSSGQYVLKQPTLYSCLKRLELQGFIRSYWGAKTSGGRRKYFTLTDMGRELFIKNQSEWEYSRTVIDKLISDKEYDLSVEKTFENTYNLDIEDKDTEIESDSFEEHNNELEITDSNEFENEQYPKEKFLDTTSIMSQLFNIQNDESYADNITQENYEEQRHEKPYGTKSENYFKDFIDEDETDENTVYEERTIAVESNTGVYNENVSEKLSTFDSKITNYDMPIFPVKEMPEEKKSTDGFISYRSQPTEVINDKKILLEREYRNVLGNLLQNQSEITETDSFNPQASPLNSKPEEIENETDKQNENAVNFEQQDDDDYNYNENLGSTAIYVEPSLYQSLNKMTEEARYTTGDTIKTRIHEGETAVKFNTQYHYFSNKLMLVHYAVLGIIMLLEVVISFLLVRIGLKINNRPDTITYVLAVLITAAFPITAALLNFKDSEKTKRIEFDFKNSIIFRIWIAACCLIITYCINIFMEMPMSFNKDYLATLLIPALFSLNLPISSVIFYLLYSSGKYNQPF